MKAKKTLAIILTAALLLSVFSAVSMVFAAKAGDINKDDAVNNKDLTRLFQYLSGWDVEVDTNALDVNGDEKVNNKDLTRLFQYLSGWNVEISYTAENTSGNENGGEENGGSVIDDNGTIYLPEVP